MSMWPGDGRVVPRGPGPGAGEASGQKCPEVKCTQWGHSDQALTGGCEPAGPCGDGTAGMGKAGVQATSVQSTRPRQCSPRPAPNLLLFLEDFGVKMVGTGPCSITLSGLLSPAHHTGEGRNCTGRAGGETPEKR